ncbi:hypothetical protein Dtox_4251 [Desulfofarcimen acetoxidans DSM 771]|uniref:DUF2313 domain-containing protein n=1 Tax=Desulfofarcimen acetoxidans (strain ATCC 49208 / DSM 771 / KCTC 5769 / VKM B-1644 / 5575) TaxID=485916 RepID=C8VZH3_DESAS|nr:putative phage tail protein [Desulfofarcimen acetoxidans]ACV64918.1 hypothetical protein Dtox_4251 [Desulfofarcimen acetoxidans DSM 771]
MIAKDRMLTYLPPYYGESRIMNTIIEAQGIEIDKFNYALNETLNQFFTLTATWGLTFYEEKYGLPVNESLNLQTRRQLVLAKKRSGRTSLLTMLQAVEPTITLIRGGLRLPFIVYSEEDIYNFGPLIVLLERHRPAHLGYLFHLIPDIEESGYYVYANHKIRGKVDLELKVGTAMTGRWPRWNTPGQLKAGHVFTRAAALTGLYIFPHIGVSVGSVARAAVVPVAGHRVGVCVFPRSGPNTTGIIPTVSSPGALARAAAKAGCAAHTGACLFPLAGVSVGGVASQPTTLAGSITTGHGHMYPCGTIHAGEEAA